MPSNPVQLALTAFEWTLMFGGGGLLLSLLFNGRQRQRWLYTNALPYWPLSLSEFLGLAGLVMIGGFLPNMVLQQLLRTTLAAAPDKEGLEVAIYGSAFHGGMLLACLAFPSIRKRFEPNLGIEAPPLRYAPPLPWLSLLRYAAGTFLVALATVAVLSLGWNYALRTLGLPDTPQDLLAVFAETKSMGVVACMLAVACVLAPISEELVFRAGLYRYVRQKIGRRPALLISGLLFGLLHGSWTGFFPLAVFGMILALAYEATGSIRVSIVVHALFNINTVLFVLSGLTSSAS